MAPSTSSCGRPLARAGRPRVHKNEPPMRQTVLVGTGRTCTNCSLAPDCPHSPITRGLRRSLPVALAVALALLAAPALAVAQSDSAPGGAAFGPLTPSTPPVTPDVQPQQPQSQLPAAETSDEMLSTTELLAFLGIEALLLGGLGVAIAREGGGVGRQVRRARHARRARPPRRNRGATHSRAGAKAPPPPPRRRRAKAGRR